MMQVEIERPVRVSAGRPGTDRPSPRRRRACRHRGARLSGGVRPDLRPGQGQPKEERARQDDVEGVRPKGHGRKSLRLVVGIAAIGFPVVLVFEEQHTLARSLHVLRHADPAWIVLAGVAEVLSMVTLAAMQRRLMDVGGVRLKTRDVTVLAYASNAISSTVPLVGRELGTAYTYRRLRSWGAEAPLVAWVLGVSGAVSTVMLIVISIAGAFAANSVTGTIVGLAGSGGAAIATLAVVLAVKSPRIRASLIGHLGLVIAKVARLVRRPIADPSGAIARWLEHLAGLHVSRSCWTWLAGVATVNWLSDAAALAFAIKAVGGAVPWPLLIAMWAGAATASTVSPTPGGLGVAEATLTAALVVSGLTSGRALGAVLAYRLTSFWLATLFGWVLYALTRHQDRQGANRGVNRGVNVVESPPVEADTPSLDCVLETA